MTSKNSELQKTNEKRFGTKVLIYPKFQLKLIAINFVMTGFAFMASLLAVKVSFAKFKAESIELGVPLSSPYFKLLEEQGQVVLGYVGVALVLSLIASSLWTVLITHRISGPILRLQKFFKGLTRMSLQKNSRITFREGDYFEELPRVINTALDRIANQTTENSKTDITDLNKVTYLKKVA